ncbi:hsp90 co-chaperone Cdc37 isoform X2 [Dermacentor andersoni]|uniref:hsp90 co-chaperone Cdc37 isoform X2 n=1 Tax=Dermacentor andersoni TaxID=34620 RepID=UPI002155E5CC|nr:hsp90 co-chaperone Cdc37-like isoform X2 [Dermacentor andersoni]
MVDYSKWKTIEVSDDEDDTHPNIDTPSLFRWRHQARVERMNEMKKEREEFNRRKAKHDKMLLEARKRCEGKTGKDLEQAKRDVAKLERKDKELRKEKEELDKKEKLAPWNVDTISKEGFQKTILNKPKPKEEVVLTEEEKEQTQKKFVSENESLLKQFGMLQKYDDSKRFLLEHPHLASEYTANYLVLWCIRLEMDDKHELMAHVAHQCICVQYVLELGKQLEVDPRSCISSFFTRIQMADQQYKDAFEDELKGFKERVQLRAREKLEEVVKEIEEEERQERLGPGGLDPVEVFESLPESMQKCFESRDLDMLKDVIASMPEEEARYHMKRCVDSGLWVPDAKAAEASEASAPLEASSETSGAE